MAIPTIINKKPHPLRRLSLLKPIVVAGMRLAFLLLILVLLFKVKSVYDYHFGFDQQRWLAAGEALHGGKEGDLDNPRAIMVEDVLAHHLRTDMTREQLLALLGPADSFGGAMPPASLTSAESLRNSTALTEWSHSHSKSDSLLEYTVGWGLLDPISLSVQIGSDERVVKFWRYEH